MLKMIQAGGSVLFAIIVCSIIAVAFIIERLLALRRSGTDMEHFYPPLENAIKLGKMEEACHLCEKESGLIPSVFLVGLRNRNESIEDIKRLLIDEIQIRVLPSLEKYLGLLATIARSTPMLGLLGTVLGMIRLFKDIVEQNALGDPQKLAEGIGMALVTTAAGLMVAIPIIFLHAYFKSRIHKFELELYGYLSQFLRLLRKRREVEGQEQEARSSGA